MKATPYFTSYEEEIVLFHEGTLIEGDIRTWLKKYEVDTALKNWKALKVSGQLIRRFPKQIPILAKEVWKSAIHFMDGVAWVYFIFAVCHRLPTNLRKHKHLNHEKICCNLCQWVHRRRETCLYLPHTRSDAGRSSKGSGIYPTAIVRYQHVPPQKCGIKPYGTHLLSITDSILH